MTTLTDIACKFLLQIEASCLTPIFVAVQRPSAWRCPTRRQAAPRASATATSPATPPSTASFTSSSSWRATASTSCWTISSIWINSPSPTRQPGSRCAVCAPPGCAPALRPAAALSAVKQYRFQHLVVQRSSKPAQLNVADAPFAAGLDSNCQGSERRHHHKQPRLVRCAERTRCFWSPL